MNLYLRVFLLITSAGFVFVVLTLIRRRLLRERDAILWFVAGVGLIAVSIVPEIPDSLASFLGIHYSAAMVFFLAVVFILMILLHHSVRLSILSAIAREVAQRLAILDEQARRREKQ